MGKFNTHGGYFAPTGYTRINTGGKHEENPNGGVQMGTDENGVPNLVEENESIYKDYVYSDNIHADGGILSKHNIPKSYSNKLYSDIVDDLMKNAEDRPFDMIEQNGMISMLGRLAEAQEEQKAIEEQKELEKELESLSPEELDMLEQELMAQEQAKANEQAQMQQQQMMADPVLQQQAMMQGYPQACGGHLHAEGGPLSDEDKAVVEQAVADAYAENAGDENRLANAYNAITTAGMFVPNPVVSGASAAANILANLITSDNDYEDAILAKAAMSAPEAKAKIGEEYVKKNSKNIFQKHPKLTKAGIALTVAPPVIEGAINLGHKLWDAPEGKEDTTAVPSYDEIMARIYGSDPVVNVKACGGKVNRFPEGGSLGLPQGKGIPGLTDITYREVYPRVTTPIYGPNYAVTSTGTIVPQQVVSPTVTAPTNAFGLPKGNGIPGVDDISYRENYAPVNVTIPSARATTTDRRSLAGNRSATVNDAVQRQTGASSTSSNRQWEPLPNPHLAHFVLDNPYPTMSYILSLRNNNNPVETIDISDGKRRLASDNMMLDAAWRQQRADTEYRAQQVYNEILPEDVLGEYRPLENAITPSIVYSDTHNKNESSGEINEDFQKMINTFKLNYPKLSTAGRYAGILGNLGMGIYNAFTPADEYNIPKLPASNLPYVNMQFRDYAVNPIDRNYTLNQIAAQSAAANRGIRNSGAGPSALASLIAADNTASQNYGNAIMQVDQANTDKYNTARAAFNQYANQLAELEADNNYQRAAMNSNIAAQNAQNSLYQQRYNYGAEGDKFSALSATANAIMQALSDIGSENFRYNQINANPAYLGYKALQNGLQTYLG